MSNRIKRSADLFRSSWGVLRGHRSLLLLPLMSGVATLLVIATFVAPVAIAIAAGGDLRVEMKQEFANPGLAAEASTITTPTPPDSVPQDADPTAIGPSSAPESSTMRGGSPIWEATGIVYLALFYFATFFVVIFFNAALIAAANEHFQGRPAGLRVGIRLAARRLPQILAWTAVASIVGTILNLLSERAGLIGRIVIAVIGLVWSVATYFALPAVALEGVGPIAAIRGSVGTLRQTWGESLVIAMGFGLVGFLVGLVAIGLLAAGGVVLLLGTSDGNLLVLQTLGAILALSGLLVLVAWSIVRGTLQGITQTALYRFATDGEVPDGFRKEHLEAAFQHRAGRKSFRPG